MIKFPLEAIAQKKDSDNLDVDAIAQKFISAIPLRNPSAEKIGSTIDDVVDNTVDLFKKFESKSRKS